jgi:hypothetical protein
MDYFVRWPEVYAISNQEASTMVNIAATKVWTLIHGSCRCHSTSDSARCKITFYRRKVWYGQWMNIWGRLFKNWNERLPCRLSVSPHGDRNNACQYGSWEEVMCPVTCYLWLFPTRSTSQQTIWQTSDSCDINHYTSKHLKWSATGWRLITTV